MTLAALHLGETGCWFAVVVLETTILATIASKRQFIVPRVKWYGRALKVSGIPIYFFPLRRNLVGDTLAEGDFLRILGRNKLHATGQLNMYLRSYG